MDSEVTPAQLVHPRLPSEPPEGVPLDSLPLLRIVVSATGEVEQVKLLSGWSGVEASMMVSAVKSWRFEPALRDGRPVRYVKMVWLTNARPAR